MMARIIFLLVILLYAASCTTDIDEIDQWFIEDYISKEEAHCVEIIYSDSAKIKMQIKSPLMIRYTDKQRYIEEFPEGLLVEFFDDYKNISSWLEADYAIRKETDKLILVRENVSLYNKNRDKLQTEQLIYDSKNSQIYTDKFVKISQPSKGDTSYGNGFITDQEFKRFEIKSNFRAIKKIEELQKLLNEN